MANVFVAVSSNEESAVCVVSFNLIWSHFWVKSKGSCNGPNGSWMSAFTLKRVTDWDANSILWSWLAQLSPVSVLPVPSFVMCESPYNTRLKLIGELVDTTLLYPNVSVSYLTFVILILGVSFTVSVAGVAVTTVVPLSAVASKVLSKVGVIELDTVKVVSL